MEFKPYNAGKSDFLRVTTLLCLRSEIEMSVNWTKIRPWNGSQQKGFEALCCQLANYEDVPQGSKFTPKGDPDGGIECYWRLPSDDEWGWQAKFFLQTPGKSQWSQLDKSIKKALDKHPKLSKIITCIPLDRADPRIEEQEWFMDKWNKHVGNWTKWAEEKSMSIVYQYWGNSEIIERLSRAEHAGRRYFWFHEAEFSQQWAEQNLKTVMADAGPRYAPEFLGNPDINVDVPISDLFTGLGRTEEFWVDLENLHFSMCKNRSEINTSRIMPIFQSIRDSEIGFIFGEGSWEDNDFFMKKGGKNTFRDQYDSLDSFNEVKSNLSDEQYRKLEDVWLRANWHRLLDQLLALLKESIRIEFRDIDYVLLEQQCRLTQAATFACIKTIKEAEKAGELVDRLETPDTAVLMMHDEYRLDGINKQIYRMVEFIHSEKAQIASKPALLIIGDKMVGKTHLLCNVAKNRLENKLPTIVILGQYISSDENPWNQIISNLGLNCQRDEFIGAIEAWAQASQSRALLFIDALNEGNGKIVWNTYLAGFLELLKNHPAIGVALSVRTTELSATISQDVIDKYLLSVRHPGFEGIEYLALETYCRAFELEMPSIPVIYPAFVNAGFLFLMCQSLKNRGLTRIPPGPKSFTSIFEEYVDSIHKKLWHPSELNYGESINLIRKAVERTAEIMAESGSTWIDLEKCQKEVDALLPGRMANNSLFQALLSEGVLVEDRFYHESKSVRGIRFSYQAFENHFLAMFFLNKYLDVSNPTISFLEDNPLKTLINDNSSCRRNLGIIEAITIQLPEKAGMELPEVAPFCAEFHAIRQSFVNSLVWRNPNYITEGTLKYINDHIIRYKGTHTQFLNALLTVASYPDHPYNAKFLHKQLFKQDMPIRDSRWSVFLHEQYGRGDSVDRLVDWTLSSGSVDYLSDESRSLMGIAITWFLTSSNRFLRDRSTKALVNLFTNRLVLLRDVIHQFLDVDDPYVLERVFAVAYGCMMRSTNTDGMTQLAQSVYEWNFKDGNPPIDILTRDYARGVIEFAIEHKCQLDIDVTKIKPPFKSEWPADIPSEEELAKFNIWETGMPDENWSMVAIYHSVMGKALGDFAHYVIGESKVSFEWSSRRLDEMVEPTPEDIYDQFVKSLTNKQKSAWDHYQDALTPDISFNFEGIGEGVSLMPSDSTSDIRNTELIEKFEKSFIKTLGNTKKKIYQDSVVPYLESEDSRNEDHSFDLDLIKRWICNRVFDLGWTVESFGAFDRNVQRYSNSLRSSHKPERIGKKYQWIAYHCITSAKWDTW